MRCFALMFFLAGCSAPLAPVSFQGQWWCEDTDARPRYTFRAASSGPVLEVDALPTVELVTLGRVQLESVGQGQWYYRGRLPKQTNLNLPDLFGEQFQESCADVKNVFFDLQVDGQESIEFVENVSGGAPPLTAEEAFGGGQGSVSVF